MMEKKEVRFKENGKMKKVKKNKIVWYKEKREGKEDEIIVMKNIDMMRIEDVVKEMSLLNRMGIKMMEGKKK
jgi:hypothetical protein